MSSPRRPRAFARRSLKLTIAAGATLLALLVGEGVIRVLRLAPAVKPIRLSDYECVYQRSTDPILGFELKANYRSDNPDFIQSYERTNAHGQRDRERSLEKPDGVRRVLLLGDSVVEGYGLRENETMSRRLEELFPDGRTEVLNFGVSAYCTRGEIELLEVKGLAFDPDVVVLVFVENDFDNFNREAFPLGEAIERPAIVKSLFLWSHLFRTACIQWNLFQFGAEADPARWNRAAIGDNNVAEGFERLRQLADENGFRPIVAIWPRFLDEKIVDVHFMPGSEDRLVVEHLASIYGLPTARLSAAFRRHREGLARPVDPRLVYSSGDELHPSPEGARVAAEALKSILENLDALSVAAAPSGEPAAAEALDAARALGRNEPDYARVYHRIGTELLKAGRVEEAVEQFRKALEEDPRHAGAYNNLGVAYERLGRSDAKAQFIKAVELQGDFAQAHFNLSRALLREGRVKAAMRGLRRTLEIEPDNVSALNLLGMELGKQRRFADARACLEQAIHIDPDHSEAHNNLGVVYAAEGRVQDALAQFREALRADPGNARARQNLERTRSLQK